ncbi:DNA cytosine methyltransferase [Ruegeria atlantica]|uniref:DNA cytosine methyltransferase n=1 Tax=Ruegeria atlantica TaxID=81569 RepID=UPI00147CEBF2|nr:DNA (cytosine-5-)-methyltransferase [Ruegeria atlantica]
MRAIDLYAGIGGWSLGLKLAGVEVVHSYEWWQPAIDTHNGNHSTNLEPTNIRTLDFGSLPKDIDIVVGSPPCTQFSYSNRGGSGDLADGLVDLKRFFEIVDHLKPKYWAMENVPRVAKVLEAAFSDPDHDFYALRHLKPNIGVFDLSEFGCPQARRRCIATNLHLDAICEFGALSKKLTLGDVVSGLAANEEITDPVWGVTLPRKLVTEQEKEEKLSDEELRLNRESKIYHPVYNNMSFPDRMDSPARTVTATCTRVSRESIVVSDANPEASYRRLTIRERASLQGFPITYQFYGKSFAEKAKMIGNAIPPTFSYIIGSIAAGKEASEFVLHQEVGTPLTVPAKPAPLTAVDTAGKTYPSKRRFRAAIPGLRFKSGMRFEFSNEVNGSRTNWTVKFFTGNSKDIRVHALQQETLSELGRLVDLERVLATLRSNGELLASHIESIEEEDLQKTWTRRRLGQSPYFVVDQLGEIGDSVHAEILELAPQESLEEIVLCVAGCADANGKFVNEAKLRRNASRIVSGIIVGSWFNELPWKGNVAFAA